jgi:thioredoxin-related protein
MRFATKLYLGLTVVLKWGYQIFRTSYPITKSSFAKPRWISIFIYLLSTLLVAHLIGCRAGSPFSNLASPFSSIVKPPPEFNPSPLQIPLVWHDSYESALAESARTGKPVLAFFTGSDFCGPCKQLKKNVFESEEFTSWAEPEVVLLSLDFPRFSPQDPQIQKQNEALAARYQINSYPTILFLDAAGTVLGQLRYMDNVQTWISQADAILAQQR